MNPPVIRHGVMRFFLIVSIVLACVTTSSAEVGVVVGEEGTGSGPTPASPYVFSSIIDDVEPVGQVWRMLGTVSAPNRVVLNPQGDATGDGEPSFVLHPSTRRPIVAWARGSGSGFDVVLSTFDGTSWSEPVVLAGTDDDELDPRLTVDPGDGTVHLLYWVNAGTRRTLHRQAPADLSSWSNPVQVSRYDIDACRPDGVVHDGELYVVYEEHDYGYGQTPRQVVLSRFRGDGFVPDIMAVTHGRGPVVPEVHSHQGILWIDWVDAEGEIAWTRRLPNSRTWEPVRYEEYDSDEDLYYVARRTVRLKASR